MWRSTGRTACSARSSNAAVARSGSELELTLNPRKSGLSAMADLSRAIASGSARSLRQVENAITSTSIFPAIARFAASTPSIDLRATTGSTSALVNAARALAEAASASANERGRNEVTVNVRSTWACRLAKPGSASHARVLPSWRSGSISAIRPSRSEMLNRPSRSGMMTEATDVSKAVAMIGRLAAGSVALRPKNCDPKPLFQRTAEAVFHLGPFIGHRRRAKKLGFRLDPQHRKGRAILVGDLGHLAFKLI